MLCRRHAFADLKPYTCCAGKGECDLVMFADPNSWFDHELQYHRHEWICLMCQSEPFRSLEEFRSHIEIKHNEVPVEQISDLVQVSQQQLNRIPATDCPFCDDFSQKLRSRPTNITAAVSDPDNGILVDARQFRNHVASHMEQLALFAISPDASFYNISPQSALENTELQLRQLYEKIVVPTKNEGLGMPIPVLLNGNLASVEDGPSTPPPTRPPLFSQILELGSSSSLYSHEQSVSVTSRLSDISYYSDFTSPYDVRSEEAPLEPFFAPAFQTALHRGLDIAKNAADAMETAGQSLVEGADLQRLINDARGLSTFKSSDTRIIAVLGDSGEGKHTSH